MVYDKYRDTHILNFIFSFYWEWILYRARIYALHKEAKLFSLLLSFVFALPALKTFLTDAD